MRHSGVRAKERLTTWIGNAMRTCQPADEVMRAQFLDLGPGLGGLRCDGSGLDAWDDGIMGRVGRPASARSAQCSGRRGSGNSARIRRVRYHDVGSSTSMLSPCLVKSMGII
jgi:hypothetical protein